MNAQCLFLPLVICSMNHAISLGLQIGSFPFIQGRIPRQWFRLAIPCLVEAARLGMDASLPGTRWKAGAPKKLPFRVLSYQVQRILRPLCWFIVFLDFYSMSSRQRNGDKHASIRWCLRAGGWTHLWEAEHQAVVWRVWAWSPLWRRANWGSKHFISAPFSRGRLGCLFLSPLAWLLITS